MFREQVGRVVTRARRVPAIERGARCAAIPDGSPSGQMGRMVAEMVPRRKRPASARARIAKNDSCARLLV
jgi:hypothetical protein